MSPPGGEDHDREGAFPDNILAVRTSETRLRRRHSVVRVDDEDGEDDSEEQKGFVEDTSERPHLFGPEFLAGALAGGISETLTHPFDLIATRQSMQPSGMPCRYGGSVSGAVGVIIRDEGSRALWSGVGAWLLFAVPSSAIYFTTYEMVKNNCMPAAAQGRGGREVSKTAVHLTAGALSELVSAVATVPGEVVRTRLQLGKDPSLSTQGLVARRQNYGGTFRAIQTIFREEGLFL